MVSMVSMRYIHEVLYDWARDHTYLNLDLTKFRSDKVVHPSKIFSLQKGYVSVFVSSSLLGFSETSPTQTFW